MTDKRISVDLEHLNNRIGELSEIVDDSQDGWTRQVFSDPYMRSREVVANWMREAGLEVRIDYVGNIIGRLAGRRGSLKPLVTGSHTDTVRQGGRFDGIVGVLGAIEVVRAFSRAGIALERDLYVVDFLGEEPNQFGVSCVGSRSISGVLMAEHLEHTGVDGAKMGDVIERVGLDAAGALVNAWEPGSIHAYVELHIEQGPLLERSGDEIGVVTAIAGIDRLMARFVGRPDHAGATPMEDRQDALNAAASAVLTIEREGCGAPVHGVATTGGIEAYPGSFNVVPSEARLWAEIRSTDAEWLSGVKGRLAQDIGIDAEKRGVESMIEWLTDQAPVPTTPAMRDYIAEAADELGYSWKPVPSGAGHDAAHMARLGPMGMIFVPSEAGRSHCPEEFTPSADIGRGVEVLAATLCKLDTVDRVLG